jgi:hypothetical protein
VTCVARDPLPVEQVLAMLRTTPARLAALTAGLTEAQSQAAPEEGEWSVNSVLAHLRSCADVWSDYIAAMLAEDHPTIRTRNPRTWIKTTGYLELPFRRSLRSFTAQRAKLLAVLQELPAESWTRAATFTGNRRPVQRSVLDYADGMARHEDRHLQQIQRAIKAVRDGP